MSKFTVPTDEQVRQALSSKDFIKVSKSFCKKFARQFSLEEMEDIKLRAVFRFCGYHKEGAGKKATTNLCFFLRNEFVREINDRKRHRMERLPAENFMPYKPRSAGIHETSDVDRRLAGKALGYLSDYYRDLIERYYMNEQTVEEIAVDLGKPKADVAADIRLAFGTLKSVCQQESGD